MSSETSEIKKFYKNQTIFLTGGTGFVGKIILEKLLRECDELSKIYMLIRPKKNKTSEQRLQELFDLPCFELLKSKNANALRKVYIINGDCEKPFLGLSVEDADTLRKETTGIIHASACVRFDQSLKKANLFVRATRDVLELAKEMPNLKAFVYISTAFSNCVDLDIKEDFYEPPLKPENFFGLINSLDEDMLDEMTPHLLKGFPNTYVYTKNISEDLVKSASENLPVAVVRPSIVTNSKAEPVTGWVDQVYGPFGILIMSTLGILRSIYVHDVSVNLVPVDYTANCIIAALWKTSKTTKPVVYNYTPTEENDFTWYDMKKLALTHYLENPPVQMVWYYGFNLTPYKLWHNIYTFLFHTTVAYVVDFVLFCMGKPTFAVKMHERLANQIGSLTYFITKRFHFHNTNTENLWNEMNEEDKKLFHFDMKQLNWYDYLYNCLTGGKLYLLKEGPDKIPAAKRKMKILFVSHYTLMAIFLYFLYKFVTFVISFCSI